MLAVQQDMQRDRHLVAGGAPLQQRAGCQHQPPWHAPAAAPFPAALQ